MADPLHERFGAQVRGMRHLARSAKFPSARPLLFQNGISAFLGMQAYWDDGNTLMTSMSKSSILRLRKWT